MQVTGPPLVLYVGRALNLRNRLLPSQHEMWEIWNRKCDEIDEMLVFGWIFIAIWYEPKEVLNDAESTLLQLLKPRYNRRREFSAAGSWAYRVPDLVFDVCTLDNRKDDRADCSGCPLPNRRTGLYAWYIDGGSWLAVAGDSPSCES